MKLRVDIVKNMGPFRLDAQLETENGTLALLGTPGSGKSVVLRCIAGLMTPDEGRILLDGEPLYDSARHINLPPQQRGVGMLVRDYALFPHWTVRQNVAAAVESRNDRDRIAEETLWNFHLMELADRKPRHLSLAERQRTALARLSASRPSVLLLDNPLADLEGPIKAELELGLSDFLSAFRGPAVWSSHDRGEAYRNCAYVCVMENGLSQPTISAERLLNRPETEGAARLAGYENIVSAVARHNAVYLPSWGVTLRSSSPIPPLLRRVGFRANQLRLSEPALTNAFAATVERVIEDVSATVLLLRPDGSSEDAPLLRMELDPTEWRSASDQRHVTVTVAAQDVLLLK